MRSSTYSPLPNGELREDRLPAVTCEGLNPDGFAMIPNRVILDRRYYALTPAARVVLNLLYAHRNNGNGTAWPSQQTIARITGLGLRTVGVAVDELRKVPFVTAKRKWTGKKTQLTYLFALDDPDRCADSCATPVAQESAQRPGPLRRFAADRCADSCALTDEGTDEGTDEEEHTSVPPSRNRRSRHSYSPTFTATWDAYGRRGAKWPACQQYTRAVERIQASADPPEDAHAWLLDQIRAYRSAAEAAGVEERYIPHLERWLRDDRWDADAATWRRQFAGGRNRASPASQPVADVETVAQTESTLAEIRQRRAGSKPER